MRLTGEHQRLEEVAATEDALRYTLWVATTKVVPVREGMCPESCGAKWRRLIS